MVSGGADSACAAAALSRRRRPRARPRPARQLRAARRRRRRRADGRDALRRAPDRPPRRAVDREQLGPGNLQAAARAARYLAAERLRAASARPGSPPATPAPTSPRPSSTASRSRPGARALLGLEPALRPRHPPAARALARARPARSRRAAGLPFADDESNDDPTFARNRIRAEVLPALAELSPEAERNIAETRAELAEEAALLERVAFEALERAGAGPARHRLDAEPCAPGSRRSSGSPCARSPSARPAARSPLGRARAAEIARLAAQPEGGEVELGGGVSAICESGEVRFAAASGARRRPRARGRRPDASRPLPGRRLGGARRAAPGAGRTRRPGAGDARRRRARRAARGPHLARGRPDPPARAWTGSKTLGDLFTDRGVPRSQRARAPGGHCRRPGRLGRRRRRLGGLPARRRAPSRGRRPDRARPPLRP